jgi:hypothetical protein
MKRRRLLPGPAVAGRSSVLSRKRWRRSVTGRDVIERHRAPGRRFEAPGSAASCAKTARTRRSGACTACPRRGFCIARSAPAEALARERHGEAADTIDAWFAAGAESGNMVLSPRGRTQELAEIVDPAAHRRSAFARDRSTTAQGGVDWLSPSTQPASSPAGGRSSASESKFRPTTNGSLPSAATWPQTASGD